jgi:hypothetical protein
MAIHSPTSEAAGAGRDDDGMIGRLSKDPDTMARDELVRHVRELRASRSRALKGAKESAGSSSRRLSLTLREGAQGHSTSVDRDPDPYAAMKPRASLSQTAHWEANAARLKARADGTDPNAPSVMQLRGAEDAAIEEFGIPENFQPRVRLEIRERDLYTVGEVREHVRRFASTHIHIPELIKRFEFEG